MTAIAVTAARVSLPDPQKCVVRSYIAAEAITAGQVVYFPTTGKVGIADANASGKQQSRGIALESKGAGMAIDVLHEGEVAGFTLTGDADTFAYLSDTAGGLDTAAGTMTVPVGRVVCRSDAPLTKVLRVFTQWEANWS